MMDSLDPERRSRNMARIRNGDTLPELRVRSTLHRLGYRFRVHVAGLPGTPDIVLPKYSTVVLVNGCFWHRHEACKLSYSPKTRPEFWQRKFADNVERDKRVVSELESSGWRVVVIWECETKDPTSLQDRLAMEFADST